MCATAVIHCVFDDVSVFLAQCTEIQTETGTRVPGCHAAVRTHLPPPVVTAQRG